MPVLCRLSALTAANLAATSPADKSISRSELETRGIELILIEQPFRMSADRCWVMGMISEKEAKSRKGNAGAAP
jgi:hypothetical protein